MQRPFPSLALFLCAVALSVYSLPAEERATFTFLVTSDSHYEAVEKVERNDRNRITIARMNEITQHTWPEKLGGGKIGPPLGVLALGDLIDDGDKKSETAIEWGHFVEQFGLDGTDGLLKYPVFEGWGNHDGPPEAFIKQKLSVQSELKRRNVQRLEKKLIRRISPNGLHYSWDWQGVHFIQTNLYPADKQNARVRYSLPWHDPQAALEFVKEDLKSCVGESGQPVIIMAHCGFDTDWWVAEDWAAFYEAVKPYNLLAFFHGHTGTGVRAWKPSGADKQWDVINTGQTEKGFFVVEISPQRMRLGYHVKQDPTLLKDVTWDWKFLFEKPLAAPTKSVPANIPVGVKPTVPPTSAPLSNPFANRPLNPQSVAPELKPHHAAGYRFAVIGDFGLDLYKPTTPAKPSATTPADTKPAAAKSPNTEHTPAAKSKEEEEEDDDHDHPPKPAVGYPTSPEMRNPNEAAVAKMVKEWQPDFVVTTGDNNYPTGDVATIDDNIGKYYSDFIGNYRGRFGKGSTVNRFFPVLGNHDWYAAKVGCVAYLDYFDLPGNERYYDFQQGPLHFFMLDNDGHEPDGVKIGSKQHAWFTKAIAASKAPFQIVVAHHPPYSSGQHGNNTVAQWKYEEHGVDLMLCGHDHNYERIERDGLTFIVNGAGGASLRKFKKIVDGSEVRYYEKHGAMRMDLAREGEHWILHGRFLNLDGQEIDHFTIRRPAGK